MLYDHLFFLWQRAFFTGEFVNCKNDNKTIQMSLRILYSPLFLFPTLMRTFRNHRLVNPKLGSITCSAFLIIVENRFDSDDGTFKKKMLPFFCINKYLSLMKRKTCQKYAEHAMHTSPLKTYNLHR